MELAGSIIGPAFALEGFAFFLEAIFLGLYLYGWDRLSPRAHWLCGVPVAVSGLLFGILGCAANAWMLSVNSAIVALYGYLAADKLTRRSIDSAPEPNT